MKKCEKSQVGTCPKCNSNNLDYGDSELCGEDMFYEVSCNVCDWYGQEWYSMTFCSYYEPED